MSFEFTQIQRPFTVAPVYLHNAAPVFVVHYEATDVRTEHWQGYRAVGKVPAGRMPWSVDNRRIGTERGYPSLLAALSAAAAEEEADMEPSEEMA